MREYSVGIRASRYAGAMSLTPFLAIAFGAAAFLALLSLLQLRGAGRAWRARRPAGAALRVVAALLLLACATIAALVATALLGYRRLTAEAPVATIETHIVAPQRFRVAVLLPDGSRTETELAGDDWQLDARVIKWKPRAVLLGAPPLYRLERISGRWQDIVQARSAAYSAQPIDAPGLIDPIDLQRRVPARLAWIDADYGSAAWLPMVDGGRYSVTLGTSGGLVARPADPSTAERLREAGWSQP